MSEKNSHWNIGRSFKVKSELNLVTLLSSQAGSTPAACVAWFYYVFCTWLGGQLARRELRFSRSVDERRACLVWQHYRASGSSKRQLCDKTIEKAVLSVNMLWSQRPYEIVMSFTHSKSGPPTIRKIGRNMCDTTHPTLPPIDGHPFYRCPKRNCSDLE